MRVLALRPTGVAALVVLAVSVALSVTALVVCLVRCQQPVRVFQGIPSYEPVDVAALSPVELTGYRREGVVIDQVSVEDHTRALLLGQADAAENGIWVFHKRKWKRASDLSRSQQVREGYTVFVRRGQVNRETTFSLRLLEHDGTVSLGTTPIVFVPLIEHLLGTEEVPSHAVLQYVENEPKRSRWRTVESLAQPVWHEIAKSEDVPLHTIPAVLHTDRPHRTQWQRLNPHMDIRNVSELALAKVVFPPEFPERHPHLEVYKALYAQGGWTARPDATPRRVPENRRRLTEAGGLLGVPARHVIWRLWALKAQASVRPGEYTVYAAIEEFRENFPSLKEKEPVCQPTGS